MVVSRRELLWRGALGLTGSTLWTSGWLDSLAVPALALGGDPATQGARPLLEVIQLRGGADGLHMVPPVGDPDYPVARGGLRLTQSLHFTSDFGLHPALEPVSELVRQGHLAVVPAAGIPTVTRSHFEAQDLMEWGAPGDRRVGDGWLTRALARCGDSNPFALLALTSQLPLVLRGSGAFAINDPSHFGLVGLSDPARRELEVLYDADGADAVSVMGRRALDALTSFEALHGRRSLSGTSRTQQRLRRFPRPRGMGTLHAGARRLIALEGAGIPVEAVVLESARWDTHAGQGTEQGAMASSIADLGEALAALFDALPHRALRVVALTEFGRTVAPNGAGGTDHGHASAVLVAAKDVKGGVHGTWPGLAQGDLFEGRDLAMTTDTRSVLAAVLDAHLGARLPEQTFPGFTPEPLALFPERRG